MGAINIFAKNKNKLETLIQTIKICSHDMGIGFWIKNVVHL